MTRYRELETDARITAQFIECIVCLTLMAGIGFIIAVAI